MIFIGSGALLADAISYALEVGLTIELVCCPMKDSAIPKLRNLKISILETQHPNIDLVPLLKTLKSKIAFSINNKFILDDSLIDSEIDFFNIHNGLVQHYRGISEVCIFAALCRNEKHYGVTLHKILPRQKVDSGPVLAQITFDLSNQDNFFSVLNTSIRACRKIFKENLLDILADSYHLQRVDISETSYTYKDLPQLIKSSNSVNLSKACNLGTYGSFFPKLKSSIDHLKSNK
ncbi:hypothetical protein [Polynucleobacter sp. AP-Feld-500C-C5]|uniref:hypothetical protein n=1 Tax=Polynucleobacter sp. AP-Feld-500C-C5 TaxID=2576924 RepID=UPI001C0ACA98|nr:hypothetical protein [Polynucleobacter sp. AP-Feld-500C-C5]MBU3633165.1 hypothetical protein [Polynucleobacter sp. AP-Feld-500C-C5]